MVRTGSEGKCLIAILLFGSVCSFLEGGGGMGLDGTGGIIT